MKRKKKKPVKRRKSEPALFSIIVNPASKVVPFAKPPKEIHVVEVANRVFSGSYYGFVTRKEAAEFSFADGINVRYRYLGKYVSSRFNLRRDEGRKVASGPNTALTNRKARKVNEPSARRGRKVKKK